MEIVVLPIFPTSLVGRQHELSYITNTLANPACRLLTLIGPGGVGKTRLAVAAAQQQTSFQHGTYFVPLQPLTSSEQIIPTIIDALGLHAFPGSEPAQQLSEYLRDKRVLLVLDNCEHLLDGIAYISGLLTSTQYVKILATSRERLNLVEEWVFSVEGLSVPNSQHHDADTYEAVQLFVQTAQRVQAGFALTEAQTAAVTRICQLVDGMPLAIEIAASWVIALSCQEIADEIERSMDILATANRNVTPRHRSMRAALDYSWKLLAPLEQQVFMRLSVFRGGFTREAAAYVSDASVWVLRALVDKSLLRVDMQGRYHLQELLRQFAETQLESSQSLGEVHDLHSAYFADFLYQRWELLKSERQRLALDEIDAELDNIWLAWQRLCHTRDVTALHRAAYSLWLAYDLRCRFSEMITLFGQGIDALRPIAGTPQVDEALALLLALQGWSHVGISLPAQGHQLVQEALSRLPETAPADDRFLVLLSLHLTTNYLNQSTEAERICQAAMEVASASGNTWGLARAWYELANLKLNQAQESGVSDATRQAVAEEAKNAGEACLRLAEASGDVWLRASIAGFLLGNINELLKDYHTAMRHYKESLPLFEEVGQSWAVGAVHRFFGVNACNLHEYALARQHLLTSLRVFRDNGQTHEQITTLHFLAKALAAEASLEHAVQLLTLIVEHPASLTITRTRSEPLLAELAAQLPAETYQKSVEYARSARLESVVAALLAERTGEPPASVQHRVAPVDALTKRETEILALMARGHTNREIADHLILSVGTVKWYISQILSKLQAQNRVQALARARDLGLLPFPNP